MEHPSGRIPQDKSGNENHGDREASRQKTDRMPPRDANGQTYLKLPVNRL
jgi:hypothetical protein